MLWYTMIKIFSSTDQMKMIEY